MNTPNFLPDGKYIIIRKLGQGAYGEVFLTRHTGLNVYRAVKRIPRSRARLGTGRNEADVLKNLLHPSLPIIYDIDEDDVYFYIIEEYVEGETLTEYVRDRGQLTEKEACTIAMSICAVLDYMQEKGGICHLDIKPDNVIVTKEGIKLLDFGSSLLSGQIPKSVTGTKGYAAPELYHGGRPDGSCDIYAVGMCLKYMLTGHEAAQTGYTDNFCSENLNFIIHKCTGCTKGERYASPGELYLALEQSQTQNRTTANPVVINVIGSMERVGTTHLAIMLASHFTATGENCLLILADRRKHAALSLPVYATIKHIKSTGGLFIMDKVTVMPDYGGYAAPLSEPELGRYDVIVRDYGPLDEAFTFRESEDDNRRSRHNNVNILVTGHKLEELLKYEEAAAALDEAGEEYIIAVNYTQGREFTGIRKEHHMKNAFRIPYCNSPFSYVDRGGYIEKSIIPCRRGNGQGNRRGRRLRRLWSNAFRMVCGKLSVKRGRKAGGSL